MPFEITLFPEPPGDIIYECDKDGELIIIDTNGPYNVTAKLSDVYQEDDFTITAYKVTYPILINSATEKEKTSYSSKTEICSIKQRFTRAVGSNFYLTEELNPEKNETAFVPSRKTGNTYHWWSDSPNEVKFKYHDGTGNLAGTSYGLASIEKTGKYNVYCLIDGVYIANYRCIYRILNDVSVKYIGTNTLQFQTRYPIGEGASFGSYANVVVPNETYRTRYWKDVPANSSNFEVVLPNYYNKETDFQFYSFDEPEALAGCFAYRYRIVSEEFVEGEMKVSWKAGIQSNEPTESGEYVRHVEIYPVLNMPAYHPFEVELRATYENSTLHSEAYTIEAGYGAAPPVKIPIFSGDSPVTKVEAVLLTPPKDASPFKHSLVVENPDPLFFRDNRTQTYRLGITFLSETTEPSVPYSPVEKSPVTVYNDKGIEIFHETINYQSMRGKTLFVTIPTNYGDFITVNIGPGEFRNSYYQPEGFVQYARHEIIDSPNPDFTVKIIGPFFSGTPVLYVSYK